MRIEKNNPWEEYKDFWDWITRSSHTIFLLNIAIGYVFYLYTTEEK
jgi:hypothetical protein